MVGRLVGCWSASSYPARPAATTSAQPPAGYTCPQVHKEACSINNINNITNKKNITNNNNLIINNIINNILLKSLVGAVQDTHISG